MLKINFSEFGQILLKYASSQSIFVILQLIAGLLVVKIIAPDIYGAFTGVGIFLSYLLLGDFGITYGLGRDIPYYKGKGESERVISIVSVGFVVSLILGVVSSLFFLILAIQSYINNDWNNLLIYSTYIILGFFYVLNATFLPALYRTNQDFGTLSKINIYLAFANILSVLLVYRYDLLGLCMRAILLSLIQFWLMFMWRPISVKINWSWKTAISLSKTGLPIFMIAQALNTWITIQNTLIFKLGGSISYGYYALSNIIYTSVRVIPSSFSQIIYPKMSMLYGEGKSKNEILKVAYKPTIFSFIILLIISFVIWSVMPTLVNTLLPKYQFGIGAANWMVLVPLVSCLGLVSNYFNVVGRQLFYFFSIIFGAIASLGYVLIAYYFEGFNLKRFPQGLLIGYLVQITLILYFIKYKVIESEKA